MNDRALADQQSYLEQRLRPLTNLMIEAGADLTARDSDDCSMTTLIFRSALGPEYLQTFVHRHIDLLAMDEMSSVDSWLLASVAYSTPEFRHRMEKQFEEYHTHPSIASRPRHRAGEYRQLDMKYVIPQIRDATVQTRAMFMREICYKGTAKILEPLLLSGIDVNENPDPSNVKYRTYLEYASRAGNLEIVSCLLRAGAMSSYSPFDFRGTVPGSKIDSRGGPIKELLRRWESTRVEYKSEKTKPVSMEVGVLEKLITAPGFPEHCAVDYAIYARIPLAAQRLIVAGFGRRRDESLANIDPYQRIGSEVVSATVYNDFETLKVLIDSDFGLDYEDAAGYTALLYALDRGCTDFVSALTQAGAKVARSTHAGLIPLKFAQNNLAGRHPRRPTLEAALCWNATADELEVVTYDQDLKSHELLMNAWVNQRYQNPTSLRSRPRKVWPPLSALLNMGIQEYTRFVNGLPNIDVPEVSRIALGLSITIPAFLCYKTYELLWWAHRTQRQHGLFSSSLLMLALAVSGLWLIEIWWDV